MDSYTGIVKHQWFPYGAWKRLKLQMRSDPDVSSGGKVYYRSMMTWEKERLIERALNENKRKR